MTTTSVLAVPGIHRVDQTFLRALAAMVDRHGWDIDGIAGVISHESGFNASAHSPIPGQTATGLIQFIESTAHSLGTTTAALRTMSPLQQLPYVERFFQRTLRQIPQAPESYILATYGRADLVNAPDDLAIDHSSSDDPAEAERYRVNSALDATGKGWISVGDLRASLRRVLAQAGDVRVPITPAGSGGGAGAGGAGLLAAFGAALVFGGLLKRRRLAPSDLHERLGQVEHHGQGPKHVEYFAPLLAGHRVTPKHLDRSQGVALGQFKGPSGENLRVDRPRTGSTFEQEVTLSESVFRDQRRHPGINLHSRGLLLTAVP